MNYKSNSPPGQSSSTSLATLAEGIKEAFKRRFYTTNNSIRINLFDNDLFLLTTAVVPWYQFDIFPANLKQEVIRLLKSKEKNYSCCETGQSVQAPLVLPNKPKAQLPKIDVSNFFFVFLFYIKVGNKGKHSQK